MHTTFAVGVGNSSDGQGCHPNPSRTLSLDPKGKKLKVNYHLGKHWVHKQSIIDG